MQIFALARLFRSRVTFRGAVLAQAAVATAIAVCVAIELGRIITGPAAAGPLIAIGAVLAGAILSIYQPWPGLVIAALGCVIAGLEHWQPLIEWSCTVFLLFSVTLRRGRPWLGIMIAAPPIAVGTALAAESGETIATAVGGVISAAAGAAIGFGLRTQWQYRDILEERASDALATRELEADRRVAEERLRIARDLHDVIGHEIAVVNMRIGLAEVALPYGADESLAALAGARDGVKHILTETQNILTLLRSANDTAPSGPTPGWADVAGLLASYEQVGFDLTQHLDIGEEVIEAGVGLTVYRVLQETLTNAHRYGRGTAAVTITTTEDTVTVKVQNSRHLGTTAHGSGLGLVGMRERVHAAGGTLTIEPDGVLFTVTAHIPLRPGGNP